MEEINEREREALMRLTMCVRGECPMCKYEERCDDDFRMELGTENMNILADALLRQPKQGEWIAITQNNYSEWKCSECCSSALLDVNDQIELSNFCPNCGARMKGESDD